MKKRYRKLPPKGVLGDGMFIKPTVQRKLKVGREGDAYEIEADAIADKVVNNNESSQSIQKKESTDEEVQQIPLASSISAVKQEGLLKKEMLQKAEEEEPVQMMEEEEAVQSKEEEESLQMVEEEEPVQAKEEEETVQAKSDGKAINKPPIENKLKHSSGGSKMDAKIKNEMEQKFGTDFSHVKIHVDGSAAQMCQEIGAQAFTRGNDIYFNTGKYNPNSIEGKRLLAHELTHTIQQGKSKTN